MQRILRRPILLFILSCIICFTASAQAPKNIRVLELRNYFVKQGHRDEFISYFKDSLITTQEDMGANILGTFTVKNDPDHFLWMRGFADMAARKKMLNDFYYGAFWKSHRNLPNSLLLNNDNVYLLRPLDSARNDPNPSFDSQRLNHLEGIAVLDFYISNTKRDQLTAFLKKDFTALAAKSGIIDYSFWLSEEKENDFPQLPVFQDKNLVIRISFYKNEKAYRNAIKKFNAALTDEQRSLLYDLVTVQNTLIIYPVK